MRVTDVMLRTSGLNTTQQAMQQVARTQEQLSSGKKFTRISDDPIAAQAVMRARAEEAVVTQYQDNLLAVRNRQTIEESVINELAGIIEDARQIGLTESSATRGAASRASAANLIEGMVTHVIALGNTRVGNDYIFAGRSIDQPAFDATGAYQGDLLQWSIEIDKGFRHLPNQTGQRIFVDTDLIPALQQLATDLNNNDPAGIAASSERLRIAFDEMQTLLADTGGRAVVSDSTESLHESTIVHLTEHRSRVEDIDLASAMIQLAANQSALNGALTALRTGLELDFVSMLR